MSVQVLRTRSGIHRGRAEMNDCVIHVEARKKCLKQIRDTSINLNQ